MIDLTKTVEEAAYALLMGVLSNFIFSLICSVFKGVAKRKGGRKPKRR